MEISLDITAGAYPMNLSNKLTEGHNWVFQPYQSVRKSGQLYKSTAEELYLILEQVLGRIDKMVMGQQERLPLDTRYEIICKSEHGFWVVNEIGGNDARYKLYSEGMDAFISLVSTRDDDALVIVTGKRSQYIPYDVQKTLAKFNEYERLSKGWGGSDIVGGSPRQTGTGLSLNELKVLAEGVNPVIS